MRKASTAILTLAVAATLLCGQSGEAKELDAYFARQIWTSQGPPIDHGVLIVEDGKVITVGRAADVAVPQGAREHHLGSEVIIPGLVVVQTHLADDRADVTQALTPHIEALEGFDSYETHEKALAGGVTTIQLSPGQGRLMPGTGSVVKLGTGSRESRVLAPRESLRLVLSRDSRTPPSIYEPSVGPVSVDRPLEQTRPQLSKSLGGAAAGLRALFRAARTQGNVSTDDPVMTALSRHLGEGRDFRVTAQTQAEIRLAWNLAQEFELSWTLVAPRDLRRFAASFKAWSKNLRGVLLQGLRPGRLEDIDADQEITAPWEYAEELTQAGLRIAIYPQSDDDLEDTLFIAGQFLQGGLSKARTLEAITRLPAEIMRVEDRVGSLAPGRDADFVVLSASPFEYGSHVMETYIDGERVFDRQTTHSTVVLSASKIYVGDGEVIDNGSLVVRGGRIRGLGEVSASPDADSYHYPDAVIVPGFIDLGSRLGSNATQGDTTAPGSSEDILSVDPSIDVARQGGVTTVLLGSRGSNGSALVARKLSNDVRVAKRIVGLEFRLSDDLSTSYPAAESALAQGQAYHEDWSRYEKELAEYEVLKKQRDLEAEKAKKEEEAKKKEEEEDDFLNDDFFNNDDEDDKKEEAEEDSKDEAPQEEAEEELVAPEAPRKRESLEPYRMLFRGEIPAFVEARRIDALEMALKLFVDQFGVTTILVGADDIALDQDLLAGRDVAACAGPNLVFTKERRRVNLPQILANAMVPFGFQSRATTGVRDLPAVIQFAVSKGLSPDDALKALTTTPASLMRTPHLGTLKIGNDADLVVLSGPPFALGTRVLAVMIDGEWVHRQESKPPMEVRQ